jgi:hypothetical protein
MRWLKTALLYLLGQAGLTYAVHLIFRRLPTALTENAVMGWLDDQIAAALGLSSPDGSTVVSWAIPVLLAAAILWTYHVAHTKWILAPDAPPAKPNRLQDSAFEVESRATIPDPIASVHIIDDGSALKIGNKKNVSDVTVQRAYKGIVVRFSLEKQYGPYEFSVTAFDNKSIFGSGGLLVKTFSIIRDADPGYFSASIEPQGFSDSGCIDYKILLRSKQAVAADKPENLPQRKLSEPVAANAEYLALGGQVQHNMYKDGNLVRIGPTNQRFVLRVSPAGKSSVHMYKDDLSYLARIRGRITGDRLKVADYPGANDSFVISVGEHFLAMNKFSQTLQGKIVDVKHDGMGSDYNEVTFDYVISPARGGDSVAI